MRRGGAGRNEPRRRLIWSAWCDCSSLALATLPHVSGIRPQHMAPPPRKSGGGAVRETMALEAHVCEGGGRGA